MRCLFLLVSLFALPLAAAMPPAKQALQPLQDLIGEWKGTGTQLRGSKVERDKGGWFESIVWQWQFKGTEVWLRADLSKGKYFSRFEIRPGKETDTYELKTWTVDKKEHTYFGKRDERRLIFDREEEGWTHRLTFSLLHATRFAYRYETRKKGTVTFSAVYQSWSTKQGVPFAIVDAGPECIVSGGQGTMRVSYKGKTYFVCCSGCRDAFNDDPLKYITEYEEAKKKN
ncbi:MAG: YHS domain-containing protein [Gemmataceae bacterium]